MNSLALNFYYDASRIELEAVKILANQFETLLGGIAGNPEARIFQLDVIGQAERQQLIVGLNHTERAYPPTQCIHELFEYQAARHPGRIAVKYEAEQLTYALLNEKANQLAHFLRQRGIGPDKRVALCLERSQDVIIGLLGVLKAGGAYVPIEPAYPQGRIAYMLDDADIEVVLTEQPHGEKFRDQGLPIICLDSDWDRISIESSGNPDRQAFAENLAYVIFTSGSTGRPKGVGIEHRQLLNYTRGVIEKLDLPERGSFATISTFAADLGHTMIFPALCLGGCLHILSQRRINDPAALADYFSEHEIDCLKVVPSHLEALLEWSEPKQFIPRKRLVLGGEASPSRLADRIKNLAPDCEVFNHYGPTETTVGVITYHHEDEKIGQQPSMLPLGRPLVNTEIYLLDDDLQLVPMGALGELYIGGAGLSRGYLNHQGLTAEKFIPNPFGTESGARLYKSGDLARYLPDGRIEFKGRIDNQVKFHGFRIELNEIRATLNKHPQIRDSVIATLKDKNGAGAIVVYYVARQEIEAAELRDFLSRTLIAETVPSLFVHLKKIPLTLNGKINYDALPTLDQIRKEGKSNYLAPRTPAEKRVAEICSEILGLDRVGLHDNFFELGGHSLLAIRFITKLREAFEVDIPLHILFDKPTVAELALELTNLQIIDQEDNDIATLMEELERMSEEEIEHALHHEGVLLGQH